jgi:hypothetical protein
LWDLTVADYKGWREAFYADLTDHPDEQLQNELHLLRVMLQTNRLAWRVVDTYLYLIELRPKEKVDPFFAGKKGVGK